MITRQTEDVVLSDGRKMTVQQLSTKELMAASALANAKKGNAAAGDPMAMMTAALCFAITDVGTPKPEGGWSVARAPQPRHITDIHLFMDSVLAKDLGKLLAAYTRLNGDDDEGEATAAETV